MSNLFFTCSAIYYSLLMVQTLYFFVSCLVYTYKNPQYRQLQALFNTKSLSHSPTTSLQLDDTLQISHSDQVVAESIHNSSISSHSRESFFVSRTVFIHHGLETVSHCILQPFYLLSIFFLLCVKLATDYISHFNQWSKHSQFCSYQGKLLSVAVGSFYVLQLMLCLPSIRVQYIYASQTIYRTIPTLAVIWITISLPIYAVWRLSIKSDIVSVDGQTTCLPLSPPNQLLVIVANVSYYIGVVLCFVTVLIPIHTHKKGLSKLKAKEANGSLSAVIGKIDKMSKRICVSGMAVMTALVAMNGLFIAFAARADLLPYISMFHWFLYVQFYFAIICIYSDWRDRLRSTCFWRENDATFIVEDVSIRAMDVPPLQLIRDPSRNLESTFSGLPAFISQPP